MGSFIPTAMAVYSRRGRGVSVHTMSLTVPKPGQPVRNGFDMLQKGFTSKNNQSSVTIRSGAEGVKTICLGGLNLRQAMIFPGSLVALVPRTTTFTFSEFGFRVTSGPSWGSLRVAMERAWFGQGALLRAPHPQI